MRHTVEIRHMKQFQKKKKPDGSLKTTAQTHSASSLVLQRKLIGKFSCIASRHARVPHQQCLTYFFPTRASLSPDRSFQRNPTGCVSLLSGDRLDLGSRFLAFWYRPPQEMTETDKSQILRNHRKVHLNKIPVKPLLCKKTLRMH